LLVFRPETRLTDQFKQHLLSGELSSLVRRGLTMCGRHFYGNQYEIVDVVTEMNPTTFKELS